MEYKSDKFIHHRLVTMCCEDARRSALPSHPLIDQQAWYWLYTDLYWMRILWTQLLSIMIVEV